ncbi:hypothetical protein [Streptomyces sp. NPDC007905]|uniref:hypothetical protein n=1 Tax=Streptomyces sp. NPDC007905 TaxID=3364788 RepID=UPI0036E222E3
MRPHRRGRRALVGPPVAGAALTGVLVRTQLPHGGSHTSGSSATGDSTTKPPPAGASAATDVTPSVKGRISTTANLLTPAGIRGAISAFKQQTGRDRYGSLTVYPGYVSADLMVKGSDTQYDSSTYRPGEGVEKGIISNTLTSGQRAVSLDDFDGDKVPSLPADAERKLKVDHVRSRYLVLNLPDDTFDSPVGMSVYLTNSYGRSGYLEASPRGKVLKVMPYES